VFVFPLLYGFEIDAGAVDLRPTWHNGMFLLLFYEMSHCL